MTRSVPRPPTRRRSERFFVETWGCQMNELDSQRMAGQLMQQGMLPTRQPEEAGVILLNSCSVREKAEQKAYSRLGEYRALKRHNPDLVLGFCGCVAQREGEEALGRIPDLDFVLGPGRVGELGDVVSQCRRGKRRIVVTGFPKNRRYDLDAVSRGGLYKGMVTVVEGCNKRCTFCIVPTTRGPEESRPLEHILEEVRHLVRYGFVEIELLGQTVNHWREPTPGPGGERDFAHLLDAVAREPGVERLRFVTSYPRDFTSPMVEQLARHPNICHYLHLPVQSGSNAVLRRMGRGYTVEEYLDLVSSLRRARPGLSLSTDLIVGFPGETEEEHEATLDLVREVGFASLYAFKYSPRPATAALQLGGPTDPDVAGRRLQALLQTQNRIQRQINATLVGSTLQVLVTGWGKNPGLQAGRSSCHRVVHFPPPPIPIPAGTLTRVRIRRANAYSLVGESLPD